MYNDVRTTLRHSYNVVDLKTYSPSATKTQAAPNMIQATFDVHGFCINVEKSGYHHILTGEEHTAPICEEQNRNLTVGLKDAGG